MCESEQDQLLRRVELSRAEAARQSRSSRKALGQYFTPAPVAEMMAAMLTGEGEHIAILDPGAGVGSLFAACVGEFCRREHRPERISVTAYEIDAALLPYLRDTLAFCRALCARAGIAFDGEVNHEDFIEAGASLLERVDGMTGARAFTCAILNPPYAKVSSRSAHRQRLRQVGIEAVNLYAAFLDLSARLLTPGGELIAITPRSFCNGPYFRAFRRAFLDRMAIRRLHLFESRRDIFREDAVSQENLILHAVKGPASAQAVVVASSIGQDDNLLMMREVGRERVVDPSDDQSFIRIVPDAAGQWVAECMAALPEKVGDLGITVSTGRVVEYRAQEFLCDEGEVGAVRLLHPAHLRDGSILWPHPTMRKPQSIRVAEGSRHLLVPRGHYVLVKRFSLKEDRRCINAGVYDGDRATDAVVGFENHLNYFHCGGGGLDPALARGLAAYLNSTLVDTYFRQFSGHTQVNATDLRNLRYPSATQLRDLGELLPDSAMSQTRIDELVGGMLPAPWGGAGSDPARGRRRIEEALLLLRALGLPRAHLSESAAVTLLALLDLKADIPWREARVRPLDVPSLIAFCAEHYGKHYRPHRNDLEGHQILDRFRELGVASQVAVTEISPSDEPAAMYVVDHGILPFLRAFGPESGDTAMPIPLDRPPGVLHLTADEPRNGEAIGSRLCSPATP